MRDIKSYIETQTHLESNLWDNCIVNQHNLHGNQSLY